MSGGTSALLFVAVLMCVPMILRLLRVAHPFAINADATRFTGRYARWQVTTITGTVLASKTTTSVQGTAPTYTPVYLDGSYVGQASSGGYVTTTRYDTFRLLDAVGQQHSVSVKNFHTDVNPGDVVTAAWASKGRRKRELVVANHTTRKLYANDVTIHEMTSPHHLRLIGSAALAICSLIGFPLAMAYIFVERHQRKTFYRKGVQPVWAKGRRDAQALAA